MHRRKWAAAAAVLVLSSTTAYGIQIKLSLDEISQTADLIFVGTVAGQTSAVNPQNTAIDTTVTFTGIRVVHQTDSSVQRLTDRVRLTYAGGTVGDRTVEVSDAPALVTGHRYLIFMNDDGIKYLNPIVGGFQGTFEVVTDSVTRQEYVLTAAGRAVTGVDEAGNVEASPRPVAAIIGGAPSFREMAGAAPAGLGTEADPVPLEPGGTVGFRAAAPAETAPESGEPMTLDAFIDHVTGVALKKAVERPMIVRGGVGRFYREVDGAMVGEPIKESAPHVETLDERFDRLARRLRAPQATAGETSDAAARTLPMLGASLFYCGNRSRPFSMEQVSTSWWEWGVNNATMWTWNNYVDLFRYTDDDGSFRGGNGVSEFIGYPSSATLNSQYGYTWGGSTLAVTFSYSSGSCGSISETDVAWNPARSWTNNYLFAFNNSSVVNQYPVTLHELGHTHGLQRGGETYDYDYPSVMHAYYSNVAEDGWGIHASDAMNTRANYGSTTNISDIGVESYYASNGLNNAGVTPSYLTPGSAITASNMTVENQSQFALGNVHLRFYLSTDQSITTGDRQLTGADWSWSSFGGNSQWVGSLGANIPSNTPPGTYWLGALVTINGYGADGYSGNNATFFTTPVTVTCNGALSLSPVSRTAPKTGLSSSVAVVTSATACPWAASSTDTSWLHVTGGFSGTGPGTVYYSVDANTGSSSRSAWIRAGDVYHLVTQEGGCTATGGTPLSMWTAASGALSSTDCLSTVRVIGSQRPYEDRYSFTGAAGQQVAISLSSAAFDSYLILIGPGGTVLAQDDDGGTGANSRIPAAPGVFTLASAGVYTIAVTSYSAGATGAYTVMLMGSLSLSVSPAALTGGCDTATGTVRLGSRAPAGGLVIGLSDTLAAATMPASVTVPAGASRASFTIATSMVTSQANGTVTAAFAAPEGVSGSDTLSIRPILLQAFTLTPDVVKGGNATTGVLTLVCAAGPGGVTVNLTSSKPRVAVPAAPSVTVPAGATSATVPVNTFAVTAATTATIKATTGGKTRSDKLAVNPK
jgi:hypothetical protein